MQINFQYVYPVLIIALLLYRRIRRSIGFQPFRPRSLTTRIVLFSVVILLLLASAASHPVSYLYALAGIAAGIVLLIYAIKHSKFETRNNILFYRTHIWIESIVLFLFLSRFLYRILMVFSLSNGSSPNSAHMGQNLGSDPLTVLVFFLLVTYYIGFYSYVIKRGNHLTKSGADADSHVQL